MNHLFNQRQPLWVRIEVIGGTCFRLLALHEKENIHNFAYTVGALSLSAIKHLHTLSHQTSLQVVALDT